MIRLELKKSDGLYCGFTCKGHAEYADPGEDIVCSAVSALTQTCVLGLTEEIGLDCGVSIDADNGIQLILERDTSSENAEKADLIIRVMLRGLREIEKSYPGTLKIQNREV